MKKLLLLLPLLLISATLSAKEPSLAEVLEWKYGTVAGTVQKEDGTFVIYSWKHPTLPVPNDSQIAIDTNDYKAFLVIDKKIRKEKKDAVLLKLKITEQELKDLELVK